MRAHTTWSRTSKFVNKNDHRMGWACARSNRVNFDDLKWHLKAVPATLTRGSVCHDLIMGLLLPVLMNWFKYYIYNVMRYRQQPPCWKRTAWRELWLLVLAMMSDYRSCTSWLVLHTVWPLLCCPTSATWRRLMLRRTSCVPFAVNITFKLVLYTRTIWVNKQIHLIFITRLLDVLIAASF